MEIWWLRLFHNFLSDIKAEKLKMSEAFELSTIVYNIKYDFPGQHTDFLNLQHIQPRKSIYTRFLRYLLLRTSANISEELSALDGKVH